jgi:hypothetical protein
MCTPGLRQRSSAGMAGSCSSSSKACALTLTAGSPTKSISARVPEDSRLLAALPQAPPAAPHSMLSLNSCAVAPPAPSCSADSCAASGPAPAKLPAAPACTEGAAKGEGEEAGAPCRSCRGAGGGAGCARARACAAACVVEACAAAKGSAEPASGPAAVGVIGPWGMQARARKVRGGGGCGRWPGCTRADAEVVVRVPVGLWWWALTAGRAWPGPPPGNRNGGGAAVCPTSLSDQGQGRRGGDRGGDGCGDAPSGAPGHGES